MKTTTKGNWAVWTQPAHRHDGQNFPEIIIVGVKMLSSGQVAYKPIKYVV